MSAVPSNIQPLPSDSGPPQPWRSNARAANGRCVAENFGEWFGGSRVVGQDGAPKVQYHSTFADFDAFELTSDLGFHFGSRAVALDRVDEASKGRGRGDAKYDGLNVRPAFLSIERPYHLSTDPRAWPVDYMLKLLADVIPESRRKHIAEISEQCLANARAEAEVLKAANGPGLRRRTQPWKGGLTFVELQNSTWARLLGKHKVPAFNEMRKAMQDAGYDGLSYMNAHEGEGRGMKGRASNPDNLCWVAFEASQVKSIYNSGLYLRNSPSSTDLEASLALERAQRAKLQIGASNKLKLVAP